MNGGNFIRPLWPAPPAVQAASSLRTGGVSKAPFSSLNLGTHVEDDAGHVRENRARLSATLGLEAEPLWLDQVHGTTVIEAQHYQPRIQADACVTTAAGQTCVVMTADCLPVLFCSQDGSTVAAAHAGWRGLAAGVLEAVVERMRISADDLLVWMGPAIGPAAFEVGDEVREAFCKRQPADCAAFARNPKGRWQANLYELARSRLNEMGVTAVYGGDFCTYAEPARFFSHRRDGRTGRMATMIWRLDEG